MLEVAERVLKTENETFEWHVTTSGKGISIHVARSN
jgi:hypothetical protein